MVDKQQLKTPKSSERAPRAGKEQVVRALEDYCDSLQAGDRIPTHTELMRQFHASERAIHTALHEMQRQGRIIRKNGVGTFIADSSTKLPPTGLTDSSKQTLMVIARPDHSFFDRFLDLLFRYAESANLKLICQPVDEVDASALLPANALNLCGFLLFGYQMAPLAKQLHESGKRVVLVGAPPIDVIPEIPCIYNDHEYGGYLITKHLIEIGHRRIAYALAGMIDLQRQRRWRGHQRALAEAQRSDIRIDVTLLPETETNLWATASDRVAAFFQNPDAPTSIVAWNDYEAIRLLSALSRRGISVPNQISLVGYDALPEGNLVYPSLTTVDHGMRQQLSAALDLLQRAKPAPSNHTLVFMPTLVVRESTAPPR